MSMKNKDLEERVGDRLNYYRYRLKHKLPGCFGCGAVKDPDFCRADIELGTYCSLCRWDGIDVSDALCAEICRLRDEKKEESSDLDEDYVPFYHPV